ncbi:MAG: RNA-binding domain-containing protein [Nanoarchaeota archaeon]
MKYCHSITVCVFAKAEEDNERIRTGLHSLFPFDIREEKIPIKTEKATGVDESRTILIHEAVLDKDRHIRAFLNALTEKLSPDQKAMLIRQENRLDANCNFFLRLDKYKLFDGVYWITDSGDCYHIRLCIAAYPKNKENSLEIVKEIFS